MLSEVVAPMAPVDAFTHRQSVLHAQYVSQQQEPQITPTPQLRMRRVGPPNGGSTSATMAP